MRVRLHCHPERPLVVVPESVIRPGKTVWVMREDSLHVTPIRIARIEQGEAFIDLSGSSLSPHDTIISSPVPNARQGLAVSLLNNKPRRKQGTAADRDPSLTNQVATTTIPQEAKGPSPVAQP